MQRQYHRAFHLFRTMIFIVIALVGLTGFTLQARAALITFDFTGSVTSVHSDLAGTFTTGDAIQLTYTFDSTSPDLNVDPLRGTYHALTSLEATVGSYVATSTSDAFISVRNHDDTNPLSENDRYLVHTINIPSLVLVGAPIAGLPLWALTFDLHDSTNLAIADDTLTPTIDLAAFDDIEFHLQFFRTRVGPAMVVGTGGSLQITTQPVPEPSPGLLLGIGLIGLVGAGTVRKIRKRKVANT